MVTNPFDETPTVNFDVGDPTDWDGEVDSKSAAEILGVTLNNLRQIVHKKQLTVTRRDKRRAYFRSSEVHELKRVRGEVKLNKKRTPKNV